MECGNVGSLVVGRKRKEIGEEDLVVLVCLEKRVGFSQ
jgi:hypothetical protein